jgi:hypothetical protein
MGPQAQAAVPLFQPHHHMYAALTWITVKIQSIHQQNVRIWTNWFRLVLAMVIDLTKHYIAIEISFRAFKEQPKKIICSSGFTKAVMSQVVKPKPMMMRLTTLSRTHHLWVSPAAGNAQPLSPPCVNLKKNICQLHIVNPSPKRNFETAFYRQETTVFTCNSYSAFSRCQCCR